MMRLDEAIEKVLVGEFSIGEAAETAETSAAVIAAAIEDRGEIFCDYCNAWTLDGRCESENRCARR